MYARSRPAVSDRLASTTPLTSMGLLTNESINLLSEAIDERMSPWQCPGSLDSFSGPGKARFSLSRLARVPISADVFAISRELVTAGLDKERSRSSFAS